MVRPRTQVDAVAMRAEHAAGDTISAIALRHGTSRDVVRERLADDQSVVLRFPQCSVSPEGYLTSHELVEHSGATPMQVRHWTTLGLIDAEMVSTQHNGATRLYSATEAAVVTLTARLVGDGLTPRVAVRVARDLTTTGSALLAGIRIHLPEEH